MRSVVAFCVVAGSLLGASALVMAQESGTTSAASVAPVFLWVAAGEGQLDDCLYLRVSAATSESVASGDLRLIACASRPAGSLVSNADTDVGDFGTLAAFTFSWVDTDGGGTYGQGEPVYADTNSTVGVTTQASEVALRLTPAGGYAAGTLVFASHTDAATPTRNFATASFAFIDAPCASTNPDECPGQGYANPGDRFYILPGTSPGLAAGSAIPGLAIRAYANGPFGSQVPPTDPGSQSPGAGDGGSQSSDGGTQPETAENDQATATEGQPEQQASPNDASPATTQGGDAPVDQDAPADASAAEGDTLQPNAQAADATGAAVDNAEAAPARDEGETAFGLSSEWLESTGVPLWTVITLAALVAVLVVAVTALALTPAPNARRGATKPSTAGRPPGPMRPGTPRSGGPSSPRPSALRPEPGRPTSPQRPK